MTIQWRIKIFIFRPFFKYIIPIHPCLFLHFNNYSQLQLYTSLLEKIFWLPKQHFHIFCIYTQFVRTNNTDTLVRKMTRTKINTQVPIINSLRICIHPPYNRVTPGIYLDHIIQVYYTYRRVLCTRSSYVPDGLGFIATSVIAARRNEHLAASGQ